MDQLEFSIAIHLVRRKLQGAALPKVLPASLKTDPVKPGSASSSPVQQASAAAASQAAAAAAAVKATQPAQAAKGTTSAAAVCSPPLSKINQSINQTCLSSRAT